MPLLEAVKVAAFLMLFVFLGLSVLYICIRIFSLLITFVEKNGSEKPGKP